MTESRAIKVESCRFCKHRRTASLYDKGFCTNGEGFQLGENFPSIPATCLLPKWPSVTREEKKILLGIIDMEVSEYVPISEYKCPGKILKEKLKAVIDGLEVSDAD